MTDVPDCPLCGCEGYNYDHPKRAWGCTNGACEVVEFKP